LESIKVWFCLSQSCTILDFNLHHDWWHHDNDVVAVYLEPSGCHTSNGSHVISNCLPLLPLGINYSKLGFVLKKLNLSKQLRVTDTNNMLITIIPFQGPQNFLKHPLKIDHVLIGF
jgi:hypothetical protein